jgi:signal transduction histidine kinase
MRSLAFKLTLAFMLTGLTGAALVALALRQFTSQAFNQFLLDREQQELVTNLQDYYQEYGNWSGALQAFRRLGAWAPALLSGRPGNERDIRREAGRFTLIDEQGTIVLAVPPEQVGQAATDDELQRGIPLSVEGRTVGHLILGTPSRQWLPTSPEGLFFRNINRAILSSALVATLLALILGSLLAYTLTRSLAELREATNELAAGKLGKQVQVRSQDELGELAMSFNKMSADLAKATQARQQMTADIAHDLRTPLSVISGYAEAMSDGKLPGAPEVYAILHQETQLLSRLVEDLRTLSLADAGELQLNLQAISAQALLEAVAARHAVAAENKTISLRVDVEPNLPELWVDSERMFQALDNLVVNAFRYTAPGGEVVLAGARAGMGHVGLQVRDNGSGIALEDLPNIFNRFYRGDKARQQNGESGLGLAITKSIVEAHGGAITVESAAGQGTCILIRLPA